MTQPPWRDVKYAAPEKCKPLPNSLHRAMGIDNLGEPKSAELVKIMRTLTEEMEATREKLLDLAAQGMANPTVYRQSASLSRVD